MQVSIFCELGLKTPIHALKIGVFGSKIEDRGRGGAMLTPNELVLTFGSCYLLPLLVIIDQEMPQTDGHTQGQRQTNLSHAICYSYGGR